MGCCQSSFFKQPLDRKDHRHGRNHARPSNVLPAFSEFALSDLKSATNNFASDHIVSDVTEKASNVVYKGHLHNRHWIAVKKFTTAAWPDPKQFANEAWGVGKLRHKRLAKLIGYCCEGKERLLVAEYMPNDTLAKHLFHCTFILHSILGTLID